MKRIGLVLSAVALVAAITAFSSVSALAQEEPDCTDSPPSGPEGMGIWTQTCELGTEVRTEEVSRTPTTQDCEVGRSGREGTQEADEVKTVEVTYRIYTTQLFMGNPQANPPNPLGEPTRHEEVQTTSPEVTTFEPTGPCKPLHPSGPPA